MKHYLEELSLRRTPIEELVTMYLDMRRDRDRLQVELDNKEADLRQYDEIKNLLEKAAPMSMQFVDKATDSTVLVYYTPNRKYRTTIHVPGLEYQPDRADYVWHTLRLDYWRFVVGEIVKQYTEFKIPEFSRVRRVVEPECCSKCGMEQPIRLMQDEALPIPG